MPQLNPERPRVLLVDDDPLIVAAQVRILRNMPVDVRTAATVEEALAVIAEWPPDAVVCDCDLGGQSGFDLCAQLLFGGGAGTPCALASGHVDEVKLAHATSLGVAIHEKPVDLRAVIEKLLIVAEKGGDDA